MSRFLLVLLASLTASAPLAIDAYLPAMPQIAVYFGSDIHAIELSLSIFLSGFALGQLIGGPFSDHIGRRPAIFLGLSLFCIGSLVTIFSTTIEMLWLARFIQALGGGLAMVNSVAVIRDLSEGKKAAQNMANMMIIMLMAPLLAPIIGSLLLHLDDWRLIFEFLLLYGVLLMITLFFKLPETRRIHSETISVVQRYWSVLSHRMALSFILSQCFAVAAMFASITASPSVYMQFFGISSAVFPVFFGLNVISIMAFNRLNVFLLNRFEPQQILTIGQVLQVSIGLLLMSYISVSSSLNIYLFTFLLMLLIGMNGLIVSNASALNVQFFPHNAATATALSGAAGFSFGFISSAIVGLLGDGTPWPMAIVMFSCSVIAVVLRYLIAPEIKLLERS